MLVACTSLTSLEYLMLFCAVCYEYLYGNTANAYVHYVHSV